jgi:hypothetical protein
MSKCKSYIPNTHETYVSLKAAKLLKQAGFDWGCEHCYFKDEFDSEVYDADNFLDATYQIAAPSLHVAQRWLREVADIHTEVREELPNIYSAYIMGKDGPHKTFKTYEEALDAVIINSLKSKSKGKCPDNDWGEEYTDEYNENI